MAHTKAELKKLHKGDIVKIAQDEFGLTIDADNTNADSIMDAILKAQTDQEAGSPDADKAETPSSDKPEESADEEAKTKKPASAKLSDAEPSDELIKVRAVDGEKNDRGGYNRAFYEQNDAHPDGQAWIADGEIHEVAKTEAVIRAILVDKTLEVVAG